MADDVAAKEDAPKGILSRLFRRGERARGSGRVSRFRRAFSNDRLIGLVILAAVVAVRVADPLPLEILRLKVFDYYQQVKPREIPKNSPVVIIDLDDSSLAEVGQWPWPRTTVATMIRKLFEKGVAVVGFDIVFAEPDRMSGPSVAASMPGLDDTTRERLSSMKSNDEVFADIVRGTKRVVLGQASVYVATELQKVIPMPSSVFQRTTRAGVPKPEVFAPNTVRLIRNIPELEKAVLDKRGGLRNGGIGMFSLLPEPDGIVRRVPAFVNFKTAPMKEGGRGRQSLVAALSLDMLRVGFGQRMIAAWSDPLGIKQVKIGRMQVTTDGFGRMWPYFSKTDKSKYIPAKDVLNGTVPVERLRGKLALIGTSAVGLLDIKTIPTERFIPGVEVHAQMIETILNKTYLNRRVSVEGSNVPIDLNIAEYMLAFVGGLLMIILVPWVGAKWTLLVFLTLAGGAAGTSWYLFTQHLTLFDPVFPVGLIFALYVMLTYTNYAREERQQRETRGAFAKYMSPAMVAKVVEDPTLLTLGGDKRNMTLLFCDVRGFTTISEQFGAEGLTVLINKLLTPLTNVILDSGGTVDKYMGDCIMAFWNAPLDVPDHPLKACHAALDMMKAMGPLNETLAAEAIVDGRTHYDLKVGIGLNSGDAVVGNMGTAQRMDYSVLGDTVNTAARLEGQSKSYGVDIVIGPQTAECVPGMAFIELDLIQVKGKTVGLNIFALLGDEEMAQSPDFLALKSAIDQMLAAYRGQKWDEAKALLKDCYEKGEAFNLAELCDLYVARIKAYEAEPPGADWNGVFIATTK